MYSIRTKDTAKIKICTVPHLAEMLHEQECCLLYSGALPFAPLDHDGHRVEVLLLGPGDDLHVVLVHDGPHVRAVGVGSRLDKYVQMSS